VSARAGFTVAYALIAFVAVAGVTVIAHVSLSDPIIEEKKTIEKVVPRSYEDLLAAVGEPQARPTPQELGATGYKECGVWSLGESTQVISCR
jgi:hypothetical protein